MKKITSILCFLLVACFASAANLTDLQVKELSRIGVAEYNDYNDAKALKITYVGSSTEAVLGVGSDDLTSQTPYGTADTGFGTAGTYDTSAAAYDTMGELCDAIDALADYKCELVAAKRNDDSSLLYNTTAASGTTDAKAVGGYSIGFDTAGVMATDPYFERVGVTPNSGKRVVLKKCIVQNDGTGTLKVYGKLQKYATVNDGVTRNDTTLVWSEATADDTALTETWETNLGGGLEFADNAHVVISAGNATTAQTSTSYVKCFWDEK